LGRRLYGFEQADPSSIGAMRWQTVPEQQHRTLLLDLAQIGQEIDQRVLVVGASP
jgi:hypothetical protein